MPLNPGNYVALTAQTGEAAPAGNQQGASAMKKPKVSGTLAGAKFEEHAGFKYDITSGAGAKVSTLYSRATEQLVLDCGRDDCSEKDLGGIAVVGHVVCAIGPRVCRKTVPAPMATVSVSAWAAMCFMFAPNKHTTRAPVSRGGGHAICA